MNAEPTATDTGLVPTTEANTDPYRFKTARELDGSEISGESDVFAHRRTLAETQETFEQEEPEDEGVLNVHHP